MEFMYLSTHLIMAACVLVMLGTMIPIGKLKAGMYLMVVKWKGQLPFSARYSDLVPTADLDFKPAYPQPAPVPLTLDKS